MSCSGRCANCMITILYQHYRGQLYIIYMYMHTCSIMHSMVCYYTCIYMTLLFMTDSMFAPAPAAGWQCTKYIHEMGV